jgi:hypothetical protein
MRKSKSIRMASGRVLEYKMDVSVWDVLIHYERGASGSIYPQLF